MPWEFSPPPRWTARITKKQLREMQENYKKAESLAQDFSKKEEKEKNSEISEL